jgi:hypothetical protein
MSYGDWSTRADTSMLQASDYQVVANDWEAPDEPCTTHQEDGGWHQPAALASNSDAAAAVHGSSTHPPPDGSTRLHQGLPPPFVNVSSLATPHETAQAVLKAGGEFLDGARERAGELIDGATSFAQRRWNETQQLTAATGRFLAKANAEPVASSAWTQPRLDSNGRFLPTSSGLDELQSINRSTGQAVLNISREAGPVAAATVVGSGIVAAGFGPALAVLPIYQVGKAVVNNDVRELGRQAVDILAYLSAAGLGAGIISKALEGPLRDSKQVMRYLDLTSAYERAQNKLLPGLDAIKEAQQSVSLLAKGDRLSWLANMRKAGQPDKLPELLTLAERAKAAGNASAADKEVLVNQLTACLKNNSRQLVEKEADLQVAKEIISLHGDKAILRVIPTRNGTQLGFENVQQAIIDVVELRLRQAENIELHAWVGELIAALKS